MAQFVLVWNGCVCGSEHCCHSTLLDELLPRLSQLQHTLGLLYLFLFLQLSVSSPLFLSFDLLLLQFALLIYLKLLSIFHVLFPLLLEFEALSSLVCHDLFLILLIRLKHLILLLDQRRKLLCVSNAEQGAAWFDDTGENGAWVIVKRRFVAIWIHFCLIMCSSTILFFSFCGSFVVLILLILEIICNWFDLWQLNSYIDFTCLLSILLWWRCLRLSSWLLVLFILQIVTNWLWRVLIKWCFLVQVLLSLLEALLFNQRHEA